MSSGLNTVADIPKPWRDIFQLIREAFPGARMAGGCLRDRDNGRPVKDIDVFIPEATAKFADLEAVRDCLTALGGSSEIMNDKVYPKGVDNHVVGVVDVKFVSCSVPFQLIVGDWGQSAEDLYRCFDFGICQISYDGRTIHRSHDYEHDVRRKEFRVVTPRSQNAMNQTVERYARLKAKYKDWTFESSSSGPIYGSYTYDSRKTFHVIADQFHIVDPVVKMSSVIVDTLKVNSVRTKGQAIRSSELKKLINP